TRPTRCNKTPFTAPPSINPPRLERPQLLLPLAPLRLGHGRVRQQRSAGAGYHRLARLVFPRFLAPRGKHVQTDLDPLPGRSPAPAASGIAASPRSPGEACHARSRPPARPSAGHIGRSTGL